MSDTLGTDSTLPPEIWGLICANLSRRSLLRLRLTSHKLQDVATPFAFQTLRLVAYGTSAERFTNIAKSSRLRGHVKELTIDTWIGPEFRYNANEDYQIPQPFMNALPYVCWFGELTRLHLRFSEFCGDNDRDFWRTSIEETWDFRYRVLDTVFHCITGLWTKAEQITIDDTASLPDFEPAYPEDGLDVPSGQVMGLQELTISNLADYDDSSLTTSEAWKKLLSLPSLTHLKLLIATEEDDASPESSVYFEEKYFLFENLNSTWLSPSLADNLRVLSLYCKDFWGWFPKMDFRDVGFLPRLKVLALGKYVFSHQWQIDFFASIGKENGSEGLEELYLDDCFVLYEAHQRGPLDSDGYPDMFTVMDRGEEAETFRFTLRWYHLLSSWATTMKSLRKFTVGSGQNSTNPTFTAAQQDANFAHLNVDELIQCVEHNAHRNFACPEPPERDEEAPIERYLYGTGISQERSSQMQYIEYNIGMGPSPYLEIGCAYESEDEDSMPEKGTLAKDNAAYELLQTAIRARNS
ncbi:hypothetical protein FDECE_4623 [Fusarium decemcellulare]|nr:hypothetical protein FDECE_4623 [Fusarium decemcellulare]